MKRRRHQTSAQCSLTDHQINEILLLSGKLKTPMRKKQEVLADEYKAVVTGKANKVLSDWKRNGVPTDVWVKLCESSSNILSLFNLAKESSVDGNIAINSGIACEYSFSCIIIINFIFINEGTPRNILTAKRQAVPLAAALVDTAEVPAFVQCVIIFSI